MFWNQLLQLMFGGSLIVAQGLSAVDQPYIKASADEVLSYECARSIADLLSPTEQPGPLFSNQGLVFTSIEAQDNSRLLLLSAGAGTFSLPLEKTGVNRIRFSIPTAQSEKPHTFFISYLHDPVSHSRVFEFSLQRPPLGKIEADFALVNARRAGNLLPNLDYSIHETAEAILSRLTEGRLRRDQVQKQKLESCGGIARQAPALAQRLKRNLDVVQMMVTGPKPSQPAQQPQAASRMPASVAATKP